ncbi:hypothetical protein [Intestinibacter bartlettii]|uniref:Replication initiator A N-terminal domain-containing protein n=1 Tax=Intestinibacter bartlettii TaxID=261299 RepID=A0ABS6DZA7_9FIRM|nr:hypothetical protein [Intestinibacter bartlettii]MBU5336572.1 hypothetical protein [Intestinibacter bartlettii]
MEYTILGFSQKAACELGLDITDLAILRWFVNSKDSGKMHSILIDNEKYYWIFYKTLSEEMSVLSLCRDTLYRRLKKMFDKNILKKKKVAYGGNYTYYALGENYSKLTSFESNSEKSSHNDTISNCMVDDLSSNTLDFNHNYDNISSNYDDLSCSYGNTDNTLNRNYNSLSRNITDLNQNLSDESVRLTYRSQNQNDRKSEQITNLLNKSTNNNHNSNNEDESIKKTSSEITPEFFLSELLVQLIQKNNPNFKKTNLDDWEEDFKTILYEDNKHYMEVIHLLRWAHIEAKIWSKMIDSPLALRKHYDAIYANREAVKANNKAVRANNNVKRHPWEDFR